MTEATPSWRTTLQDALIKLVPAFILIAGILHILLVETHLQHAIGAGLFFLVVGILQILWAFLAMSNRDPRLRLFGLTALAIAPVGIYILTRILRAPWADGPEAVDLIGVVTQVVQVLAAVGMVWDWILEREVAGFTWLTGDQGRALLAGALLGVAGYSGAMLVEDVDFLQAQAAVHGHDDHGDHEDAHGHGGHLDLSFGIRGENLVGSEPYFGPKGGQAILDHCRSIGEAHQECWIKFLKDDLLSHGSVAAFETLLEIMARNHDANVHSHAISHALGRFAYQAYGYNISLTLGECSYEVFQGCLHGALQFFFDDVAAQGGELDQATVRATCSSSKNDFETYACLHGVGHGVMLYTNYKLHESLDLCAYLATHFERDSCYGGVYMENVVGYFDSKNPTHAGGHHGHGGHTEPPTFWVDEDRPAYPCDVVKDRYRDACWRMQTSLILHFNGGDFKHASQVCEEDAGKYRLACYNSVGRDAAPYTNRDPVRMSQHCTHAPDQEAQWACVKGFASGEVLQENDPWAGIALCKRVPDIHKEPCFFKVGQQGEDMVSHEEIIQVCAAAGDHEQACRTGARLD